MAKIIRTDERKFSEVPSKIDKFRVSRDQSRIDKGIDPKYLNFDVVKLDPGNYSPPYHFHRYAEELFMILSGSATLRSSEGLDIVNEGDIIFFEAGKNGSHQLYNHTSASCTYLDIRSFIGYDICEYPDSGKIFVVPSYEIYRTDSQVEYFEGEQDVDQKWEELRKK